MVEVEGSTDGMEEGAKEGKEEGLLDGGSDAAAGHESTEGLPNVVQNDAKRK